MHFWRSEINIDYRLIQCIRGFCSSPLPIFKLSLQVHDPVVLEIACGILLRVFFFDISWLARFIMFAGLFQYGAIWFVHHLKLPYFFDISLNRHREQNYWWKFLLFWSVLISTEKHCNNFSIGLIIQIMRKITDEKVLIFRSVLIYTKNFVIHIFLTLRDVGIVNWINILTINLTTI